MSTAARLQRLRAEVKRLASGRGAIRRSHRHAYAVGLDWQQLAQLRSDARVLRPHLAADLDALEAFLRKLADEAQAT